MKKCSIKRNIDTRRIIQQHTTTKGINGRESWGIFEHRCGSWASRSPAQGYGTFSFIDSIIYCFTLLRKKRTRGKEEEEGKKSFLYKFVEQEHKEIEEK